VIFCFALSIGPIRNFFMSQIAMTSGAPTTLPGVFDGSPPSDQFGSRSVTSKYHNNGQQEKYCVVSIVVKRRRGDGLQRWATMWSQIIEMI